MSSNQLPFLDLLDGKGDLTDAGRTCGNRFASLGRTMGMAQVASEASIAAERRKVAMASTAADAYSMFGYDGIDIDPDVWVSSIAFKQVQPEKGDAAGLALKAKLEKYNEVILRVVMEPAMRAWVKEKDDAHPNTKYLYDATGALVKDSEGNYKKHLGFTETLLIENIPADKRTPEEKARFDSARQMKDNCHSNLRKLVALAPVLHLVEARLDAADSPLSGAAGLLKLSTAIRQRIDLRVRGGKLYTCEDVRDAVDELTTKVGADTPARDKADKLASSMRAAADNLAKHIVAHKDAAASADSFSPADLDTVSTLLAALAQLGFKAKSDLGQGEHAFPFVDVLGDGTDQPVNEPVSLPDVAELAEIEAIEPTQDEEHEDEEHEDEEHEVEEHEVEEDEPKARKPRTRKSRKPSQVDATAEMMI